MSGLRTSALAQIFQSNSTSERSLISWTTATDSVSRRNCPSSPSKRIGLLQHPSRRVYKSMAKRWQTHIQCDKLMTATAAEKPPKHSHHNKPSMRLARAETSDISSPSGAVCSLWIREHYSCQLYRSGYKSRSSVGLQAKEKQCFTQISVAGELKVGLTFSTWYPTMHLDLIRTWWIME